MDYTLSTTNVTDVSFDIVITANVATTGTRILALEVEDSSAPGTGTSFMLTDTGMAQGATKTHSVGGGAGMVIDANTEYNISLKVNNVDVADPITVTTKAAGYDTPRTATQEQWEDLADRIKAKADSSDVPTITMTSTDPGEGSPLPANNYIAVYGTPLNLDYSTSEVNTGTKWVDGKAIYSKTIPIQSLPNATTGSYPHNITNIGRIVRIEAYMYDEMINDFAWPMPMSPNPTGAAIDNGLRCYISNGNVVVDAGTNRSQYSAYVTIYYTKSV